MVATPKFVAAVVRRQAVGHLERGTAVPYSAPRRWISQTQPVRASTATESPLAPLATDIHPSLQYYALFPSTLARGPPPSGPFTIDVRVLRREFLRLQAAAHPDFHHVASGTSPDKTAARREAEAASALINTAFKTLSNSLLRAEYLLREQHGIDLAGDERGTETAADPEVLMTVLEAREAIEEAEREEDLEDVKVANEIRITNAEEALEKAFATGDIETAKSETVRLRYWMNIRESVNNWEKGKPVVLQH